MVQMMGSAHRLEITRTGYTKPFHTLMHEDIMDEEIGQTVQCDANTCKKSPIVGLSTQNDEPSRWDGEHESEQIVQFKSALARLVVAFMPKPHEAVHHVFVGKPSHKFHEKEKQNYY